MIDVTYSIDESEYFDMQKAMLQPVRNKILRGRIFTGLLAIGSILAIIELSRQTKQDLPFVTAILSPMLLLYGILYATFSKGYIRKAYEKNAHVLRNVHVQLGPSGYRFDILETTNGFLYWSAFNEWKEARSVFLIVRGSLIYPIPKSALSESQIEELRALLTEKLGPAGIIRKH